MSTMTLKDVREKLVNLRAASMIGTQCFISMEDAASMVLAIDAELAKQEAYRDSDMRYDAGFEAGWHKARARFEHATQPAEQPMVYVAGRGRPVVVPAQPKPEQSDHLRDATKMTEQAVGDGVDGWIIANGSDTAWRCVGDTIAWTDHPNGAIQFARRQDAEAFAAEDEDAGFIRRRSDYVCRVPPSGWYCTRLAGHEGPCAAIKKENDHA